MSVLNTPASNNIAFSNTFNTIRGSNSNISLEDVHVNYKWPRGTASNITFNSYLNKTFYYFVRVAMVSETHGDCNVDIPFFVSRATNRNIRNFVIDGSVYTQMRVRCYLNYGFTFVGWYPTLNNAINNTNRLSTSQNYTFTLSTLSSTVTEFWAKTS
jgi:hypothetical protein